MARSLGAAKSAVLLVLLVACGAPLPPTPTAALTASAVPQVEMTGAWELKEGTAAGQEIPIIEAHRITLTIEGPSVQGKAACNGYGGQLTVRGDEVSITGLSQDTALCSPAEVMVAEERYLRALEVVHTAVRDGDRLILSGPSTELRFRLLPPVPTAALLDRVWALETLIDGDVASKPLAPVTLELRSDGTFAGSTGCRGLNGRYIVTGDTVQPTDMSAEGECREELTDQDGHVIGVLEGPFTATVEGDTLTLTAPGAQGLVFQAAE